VKAISLWQPWAELVAVGAKVFETRSWKTAHRGPIAIHAAKRTPPASDDPTFRRHYQVLEALGRQRDELALGAVVGVAILTDVLEIDQVTDAIIEGAARLHPDLERTFGDFTPGRFAWLLTGAASLSVPVAARGRQGLFEVALS